VNSAYPKLLADFEAEVSEKLRAKKKPAGTRKTAKKTEAVTAEQPVITQFFTQNKVETKRAEIKSKKVSGGPTSSGTNPICSAVMKKPASKSVPIQKTDSIPFRPEAESKPAPKSRVLTNNEVVPMKVVASKVVPAPPINKDVLRLQQQSFADMSVDPTDESCVSDLSMIIDDFMSKRVGGLQLDKKVPDISSPVVTSTPRCLTTRGTIRTNVEALAELSLDEFEKVPEEIDQEKDFSMQSVNATFEDSFDRMCK